MKLSKTNKPKVLLLGVGNFGKWHLQDLQELDKKNEIDFVGVVAHSNKSKDLLKKLGVKTFFILSDGLLESVDAVDIVTPPSTHNDLVTKCLPYTDVFLEKPITLSVAEGLKLHELSKKEKNILFLGHIYRFHPCLVELKKIINNSITKPSFIECVFSDTPEKVTKDCSVLYSDLHGFDIIDFLMEEDPETIFTKGEKRRKDSNLVDEAEVVLKYPSGLHSLVRLSWNTAPKTRETLVEFMDKIIKVDLMSQEILIKKEDGEEIIKKTSEKPLMLELKHFIKIIKGEPFDYPDGLVGSRIVNISELAEKSLLEKKVINYKKI
jgi:predicted dehydrogenase